MSFFESLFRQESFEPEEPFVPKRKFFPWDISSTDILTGEGLTRLRNDHPDTIIQFYTTYGQEHGYTDFIIVPIAELVSHGADQKAALIARTYTEKDPEFKNILAIMFSGEECYNLLERNLLSVPRSPNEWLTQWRNAGFYESP